MVLVISASFTTVVPPAQVLASGVVIPGAGKTEDEWALVSALLERYSDATRLSAPLTAFTMQNRLTSAQYTGNGMINVLQGGSGTNGSGDNQPAGRRNNDLSGQAGRTTSGISYWFGHNDAWGGVPQGSGASYSNYDGKVSLGGMEIKAKTAGTGSTGYALRQNIKDAQLEATIIARNQASANSAVSIVTWTSDGVNAYDPDNSVIVTELSNPTNSPVNMQVDLYVMDYIVTGDSTRADAINAYPYSSSIEGGGSILFVQRQTNRLTSFSATNPAAVRPNTGDYTARIAVATGIKGASFTATSNNRGTCTADFTIPANGSVQLVSYTRATNGGSSTQTTPVNYMREGIKTMDQNRVACLEEFNAFFPVMDVAALRTQHREWWKDYWLRAFVKIPDTGTGTANHDSVQKHWYGAQYATGCTQRGNMPHAGSMWGSLMTMDNNGWGGRYFLNYNQQGQYYGVFSSNRVDAVEPYMRAVGEWDTGNQTDTANAGYSGICRLRTATPFNMYKTRPARRAKAANKNTGFLGGSRDQKSNTPFAVVPFMWHYDYTLDTYFLNRYTYPMVYDSIDFYMDFAEKFTDSSPWPFPQTGYSGSETWRLNTYTDQADKWKVPEGLDYIWMINSSSVHESDHFDLSPGLDLGGAERMSRFLIETAPVAETLPAAAQFPPKKAVWEDWLTHLAPFPQRTFPRQPRAATAVPGNDIGFANSHGTGSAGIPAAIQNRWGDEVTVITAAYAITPNTSNITNNHTFVIEPYDQLVELEPVFPFESKRILDNPEMVQRAIDTADYMQSWHTDPSGRTYVQTTNRGRTTGTFGSTTNTFCKTFPIIARLGYDANEVMRLFKASNGLTASMTTQHRFRNSNLLTSVGGGGLETLGATETLNSMLMQSDIENGVGMIKVFPNWTGQDASFTRLLAKGAFEVTSKMTGGEVEYIGINSKKGSVCAIKSPWGGIEVVDSLGTVIPTTMNGDYYVFPTTAGESYLVLSDGTYPVTSITLSPAALTLVKGTNDSALVTAVTFPFNAEPTEIIWTTSDAAVATVAADAPDSLKATVTAVAAGPVVITAMTEDGRVSRTMQVTVLDPNLPIESVTLNATELTLALSSTFTLTAEVLPVYLADRGVDWSSSDGQVVSVSASGVLTPIKPGSAVITATSKSGGVARVSATCAVTIVPDPVKPLLPGSFEVVSVGTSSVGLKWERNADETQAVKYIVSYGGSTAETMDTSIIITGLSPNSVNSFVLRAFYMDLTSDSTAPLIVATLPDSGQADEPALLSVGRFAPISGVTSIKASDLPATADCVVFTGASVEKAALPVTWDMSSFGPESPGVQTIYGVVGGPYINRHNLRASIDVKLNIYAFDSVLENGVYVSSLINHSDGDVEGYFMLAVYNSGGKLVELETKPFAAVIEGGVSVTFAIDAEKYAEGGYKLLAFCWDSDYIPLAASREPRIELYGRHWLQLSAPAGVTVTNWRLSGTSVPADGSIVVDYHTGFVWVDDGREGTYTFQGLNGSTVTYTTTHTFYNMRPAPRLSLNGNGMGVAFGSTAGSYPPVNAFDASGSTFYEHNSAAAYVGWDFGAGNAKVVNVLKFQPRGGVNSTRAYKGKLQASNAGPNTGFVDLFEWDVPVSSISTANPCIWYVRPINTNGVAYRYYRWFGVVDSQVNGGPNSRANISNIALYFDPQS